MSGSVGVHEVEYDEQLPPGVYRDEHGELYDGLRGCLNGKYAVQHTYIKSHS